VIWTTVPVLLLQAVAQQPQQPVNQQPTGPLAVQMGYVVKPDTVIVGQPFTLFIKVHAPKGVRFEFPAGPDTAMQNGVRPIELRGEKVVSMLSDTAVALYHLVAWDIGVQPLRMPDVRVSFAGEERRPSLVGASVFVKSVLPADTTLRTPKPARPLIVLPVFNWWLLAAILAAVVLAALLWWIWWRYTHRPPVPIDAYVRAQREFAQIEQQRLLDDGQTGEYIARFIDVLREYLTARVTGVRRSDTTSELLRTMQPREGVEVQLPRLLERADLVKFAAVGAGRDEAAEIGSTARAIVDSVETRTNPESELAKRAAAARGKAA
jgi:hypothetical protein